MEITIGGKWEGTEEERLAGLKYYYKKPDAISGDPYFAIGYERNPTYGEIMIGNEDPKQQWTSDDIIEYLKNMTIDREVYNTLNIQSRYFGKSNYKPVRKVTIVLVKKEYLRAQELNLDLPQKVRDIIENDN
uniref:Uncharacterized protein n=1 Tax=Marseillevirus LCMAC101 TaxID=2506602 RepID=A0A481YTX2_9VIRU|nr:MAG: hypothetical protein LCMAC101_05410 [Marseillevirus LCMAC101]